MKALADFVVELTFSVNKKSRGSLEVEPRWILLVGNTSNLKVSGTKITLKGLKCCYD